MTSTYSAVPLESLLAHRDSVCRLARSLVGNHPDADDVVQETWLSVLRNPPRREATSGAWLSRVVRNKVIDAFRARARRAGHEFARASVARSADGSTADVVADAEAHKRLVLEVMDLREPYRTTVLLRYFDDLPPRAIADRMQIPAETVRTRLRRALEQLRTRLDDVEGRNHCALLAGIGIGAGIESGKTAAAVSGTAITTGGLIMGSKTVAAAAVVVAVAAGFIGGRVSGNSPETVSSAHTAALHAKIETLTGEVTRLRERRAEPAIVEERPRLDPRTIAPAHTVLPASGKDESDSPRAELDGPAERIADEEAARAKEEEDMAALATLRADLESNQRSLSAMQIRLSGDDVARWERVTEELGLNDVQVQELKDAVAARDVEYEESTERNIVPTTQGTRITVDVDAARVRRADDEFRARATRALNEDQRATWHKRGFELALGVSRPRSYSHTLRTGEEE